MQIVLGDPAIPAVCRLIHYEVPADPAYPMGSGFMTQVADLMPLPLAEPTGPGFLMGTMVPLLAEALGLMVDRHPETASRPVWANIPEVLVQHMKTRFFARASVSGRYIWMPRLSTAARAVAAFRKPFRELTADDGAAILPLYEMGYSRDITIEQVGEMLRGDA